MSEEMIPLPFKSLVNWILEEYKKNDSIFGIHSNLFYRPSSIDRYATDMFGCRLETPIGPAAGPHTQLTQNILSSWLSGGRFIELKTVQIMDELEIPRPCIDMEDEGYNVEWSQELKLTQSADEYIKAWVLIPMLRRLLGFEQEEAGTIFNMSVGYDLAGIKQEPMIAFMNAMEDSSTRVEQLQQSLAQLDSRFSDLAVPGKLVNSVTLSTMHGCPPDEIEQIATYLLTERGLNTTIKLNPTLIGKDRLMGILHDDLGYGDISIPDSVFEHDLQLDRALEMIRSLKKKAESSGLAFGVKLSNTLAMSNHRKTLPGDEMYMSGRALYPITLNLFHLLVDAFNGDLNVSYSGGADALNVSDVIACGALPVTMASDLLKPGGYSRSLHALQELQSEMKAAGADDLAAFSQDRQKKLEQAALYARSDRRYHKTYHPHPLPKVSASLEKYDCIAAPCVEQCAVRQDIPEYAWYIQNGDYDAALQVILSRNPLPGVTGYVCTHLCQERCTRNNYDEPVQIRALKRFAVENGKVSLEHKAGSHGAKHKVAVIGSGPSGLAAAYYLTLSGVSVTIFESRNKAGGMLAIAPVFRLPSNIVEQDIDRIIDLGVDLRLGHSVDGPPESLLDDGYDAVYVATGYQKDATLGMPGEEGLGVYSAMDLLRRAANKDALPLGDNVLVIGGGNTAMDAARVAQRLIGKPVTVVYRRTQAEMPATNEELDGLLDEGNQIEELLSPQRVVLDEGKVVALKVIRNRLGPPDPDGRRRPIPVPGTEFEMPADSVIIAIGQRPEISFLDSSNVTLHPWGAIEVKDDGTAGHVCILAGGDAVRGPATIVEACADGRRAAETIMAQIDKTFVAPTFPAVSMTTEQVRKVKLARSRKQPAFEPALLPPAQRQNFDLVETSYSDEQAREEAARCLQCSSLCDKCVEVCPNRANQVYFIKTGRYEVPVVVANGTGIEIRRQDTVSIEQERQILHLDDLCNACGNCTTFCVHQGQPFKDKPRLFLLRETFEAETDNAYLVEGDTIWCRDDGNEYQLTMSNQGRQLKCNNFTLSLDHAFNVTDSQLHESFAGELSLAMALEMNWILQAARQAFPGLIN